MVKKYNSYLVCHKHIAEVKNFLNQFLKEKIDRYSHENWVSFEIPDSNFIINLMRGKDQDISKNFAIEINCESLEELEELAKKHNKKVESFIVTETDKHYKYNYVEIPGPKKICKVEINYAEELD